MRSAKGAILARARSSMSAEEVESGDPGPGKRLGKGDEIFSRAAADFENGGRRFEMSPPSRSGRGVRREGPAGRVLESRVPAVVAAEDAELRSMSLMGDAGEEGASVGADPVDSVKRHGPVRVDEFEPLEGEVGNEIDLRTRRAHQDRRAGTAVLEDEPPLLGEGFGTVGRHPVW